MIDDVALHTQGQFLVTDLALEIIDDHDKLQGINLNPGMLVVIDQLNSQKKMMVKNQIKNQLKNHKMTKMQKGNA